ncbi:XdhC family protein [Natribacillus halophilus]|uniref:Xanthine dehydrogenase accessory factor n=1 Tax=Natribacillus halophilus TaxID=549003 RepID=A0A1G8N1A1_9BACI|nr:XdhC family protein [Natribacillus halophilus]SDI73942.1 xanthine dehydrogenase accessory factor [Natribacillus halophilus]
MLSIQLYEKLTHSLKQQFDVALITITAHPNVQFIGSKSLLYSDGHIFDENNYSHLFSNQLVSYCLPLLLEQKTKAITFTCDSGEVECYVEVYPKPSHLIIAGAGHVSEPVEKIGRMLGFYVTVIDDRPAFANREKFPEADEVICMPYLDFFKSVPITPKTFILLLTRGHKFDVISLQELLKREEQLEPQERTTYIGMIGSRRRIAGVFEQLKSEFTSHHFKNIYSPVGLDIGAQSPAEIAISILAEILKVQNSSSGHSKREKIKDYEKLKFYERNRI